MKGYSELKMLAEYATPGPWVAQHPNAGQRGSEVASVGGLNQVCADLGPSNALYIAASNPSEVLELIAEVERLSFREKMLSEYGCEYCAGSGHVHRIDGDYLGVCDRCSAYEFNCAKHEIEKLKNENESLKKDAARYRWLRDNNFDIGSFHPAHEHNHQSWFEYFDDESIDYNLSMESK